MIQYPELDNDLIKRLNSVKPSIKNKLFNLDPIDLFLLPLRKNKIYPIFDRSGKINEERLSLVHDVITAKIADLVFYRDLVFKRIVSEGLLIPDNDFIRHEGPFNNEYYFDKALLDRRNFPTKLDSFMRKGALIDYLQKHDLPKSKQRSKATLKRLGVYGPLEKLDCLRKLFESQPRSGSTDMNIVNRLKNISIKTQFKVFPSDNWLYGIRRLKTKEGILRNLTSVIIENMESDPKEWNLSNKLHNFPLEDIAGMWFISKENVDISDYASFKKSKISELKKYIFKQSVFDVAENGYINKYKKKNLKSKTLRLYLIPKDSFFKKSSFIPLSYANQVDKLSTNHLKVSVHLQDMYYAFMNKFYGDVAHYLYHSRKDIENADALHDLTRQKRAKVLDYQYKIELLLKPLESFF